MPALSKSRIGVSLPMLSQPYARYAEFAALAEDAGFDSAWTYEFYRNPFITHALNAKATSRVQLGTGIATAAPRTPYEMANAAADVDELSGGRTLLGLSTGGTEWMEHFNGTDIDRPLMRLREYVQLAAYEGVLPDIMLHTPYVPPIDQAASEDAFRCMVQAFARANA